MKILLNISLLITVILSLGFSNPLGEGYRQDHNPLGSGYVQDHNPLGSGYVQDKDVYRRNGVLD